MKLRIAASLLLILFGVTFSVAETPSENIRVLVITGGHDYQKEQFNQMLSSLGENIICSVEELPGAFTMFLPENRDRKSVV